MKKNLLFAAMLLTLGSGALTACSSDDFSKEGQEKLVAGTTYMTLQLALPTDGRVRAAQDKQDADEPDYNYVGEWSGNDDISAVKVYVFDEQGKLEAQPYFSSADFTVDQNMIKPSKAVSVQPGAKTVFVVVNPTQAALTLLGSDATLAGFKAKYESSDLAFTKGGMLTATEAANQTKLSAASELASVVSSGSVEKDRMLMTGAPATPTINPGVTSDETLAATAGADKNRVTLQVKRALARVIVSTKSATYAINGDNPETPELEDDHVVANVENIKYVVAQGERKLFFQQKASAAPTVWAFQTPASAFVPTAAYAQDGDEATKAAEHYDYSTLWRNYSASNAVWGMEVPLTATYQGWVDNQGGRLTGITNDLKAGLKGEVILPNTHQYGATVETTQYRKGNTAYILVRATLKPTKIYNEQGADVTTDVNTNNKDFVMGANGKFYTSYEAATIGTKGVKGQTAQYYTKGKVLYFAWVNPDQKGKGWLNGPVNRNNIYHVEISGISKVGANWNPLVPGDPKRPENPDPKPQGPQTPNDNTPGEPNNPPGVNPENPLTPTETYMSVATRVLPWKVHSYTTVLGD